jgi:hypothetical protein
MHYFVIRNSDGDTTVEQLSADTLKSRLAEGYWGETPDLMGSITNEDTNYWPERGLLIIRGDVFVPRPVARVTEWEVP